MTTSDIPETLHLTVPAASVSAVTTPIRTATSASVVLVADLLALIDATPGQIEIAFSEEGSPAVWDDLVQLARLVQRIRAKRSNTAGIDLRRRAGVITMRIEAV